MEIFRRLGPGRSEFQKAEYGGYVFPMNTKAAVSTGKAESSRISMPESSLSVVVTLTPEFVKLSA